MSKSHNLAGREAWDLVLASLAHAVATDPEIVNNPAQSAMSGEQAATLFETMSALNFAVGRLMVIRTKQGDKSQLAKLRSIK